MKYGISIVFALIVFFSTIYVKHDTPQKVLETTTVKETATSIAPTTERKKESTKLVVQEFVQITAKEASTETTTQKKSVETTKAKEPTKKAEIVTMTEATKVETTKVTTTKVETTKAETTKAETTTVEKTTKPAKAIINQLIGNSALAANDVNAGFEPQYSPSYFRTQGVVYDSKWRYTWYSEKVLPGPGLKIPGRHTDAQGYVRDEKNYLCLASHVSDLAIGTIVKTPFGYGKVYDRCPKKGTLDVYVNWVI